MTAPCPHCGRPAQKRSSSCLYCGKPLGPAAAQASVSPAAPGGAPSAPSRPVEPRSAAPAPPDRPAPSVTRTPAEEPGPLARPWVWLVVVALAVAVGGFFSLGDGEPAPPEPPVEEAPAPVAAPAEAVGEALAPAEAEAGAEPVDPVRREELMDRAAEALGRVARWIESYADRYGHYPSSIGLELGALREFAGGAGERRRVLALFEDGRLDYEFSVTGGGEEETFVLEGGVRGADGGAVRLSRSRQRGAGPGRTGEP